MDHINILAPLDFSDEGKYALQAAGKFAQLFGGSITPFHVYVPVTDMYGTDLFGMDATVSAPLQNMEEIEKLHRDHLREFAEEHLPKQQLADALVSVGNPAAAIAEAAHDFDLIVMCSHGRSGFSRFFLGSVSDKVLRTAHIPVLTVNEEKQLTQFDRIMLATDFSEHSREAFSLTEKIALQAEASVELVHILSYEDHASEPDQSTIDKRKAELDALAEKELSAIGHLLETKIVVSSNTAHEAILNENLKHPHDLIIMSTVGRTGIDYLMMGSTTSNVVRHVKSPVLSINPKKKASHSEEE